MIDTQYLYSALPAARKPHMACYYIPDYPVYLAVRRDMAQKRLRTSPQLFTTPREVEAAALYTKAISQKLLAYLAGRLARYHKYGNDTFWHRALGIRFEYLVEALYARFALLQQTFDPSRYTFKLLSTKPNPFPTFETFTKIILGQDFGNEYFFSCYIKACLPEVALRSDVEIFDASEEQYTSPLFPQLKENFSRYSLGNCIRKLYSLRSPTVALLGTGISAQHSCNLTRASKGKIQVLYAPPLEISPVCRDIDMRQAIFKDFPEEDAFLRVLRNIFLETFPTLYLENFTKALTQAQTFWSAYPKIRYVINENFIGYSNIGFLLAVAHQEHHIRLYNNEHNGIFYAFLNSREDKALRYTDKVLTGGWKTDDPRQIPLGRLCDWHEKFTPTDIDVLFFAPPFLRSLRNLGMGNTFSGGANLVKIISFYYTFFSSLTPQLIARMMFRPHLSTEIGPDQLPLALKNFLLSMQQADPRIHGTALLARSRLAIYAYANSGYVEALHNDKPCIVFCDPNHCFLSEKYADFFDPLIEAGIVVQTPQAAANRLTQVIDDPQGWWQSTSVQRGRKAFLDKNLGAPQALFDYLVQLSRT